MRVRLKKYSLICAQCTMARGVGYTEFVEKERERDRDTEKERERRVLFCTYFELG